MSKTNLETKFPIVAAFFSFVFFGGGGQIYLGQIEKGVLLIALTFVGFIFFGIGIILFPLGAIDAYIIAKRLKNGEAVGQWEFFWTKPNFKHMAERPSKWQVVSIIPTDKIEEYLGEERRFINNSKSCVNVKRRFTVSRKWSQSYIVEYENTKSRTIGINVRISKPLGIENAAETAFKEKYSISEAIERTYTEEMVVEVPAYKNVCVVIQ